ncbi:ABC transporter ATP-binding protein [Microbispora sp. ATCC PTA-5024]|uniref:ABC transporter ATP-binding protein n=1 Tax=Microbispora sp. ATCC PTA-5024 TaxID=316330 RepID=UPI0003DCB2DB|nr:ABC transporter ATP-binding protein [Microbispora sp. ATCC PTA-5024]ETK30691.1 peptide ABC transporter ATP-binding protein [Microbispora sp. ATCC PTA-5024]
MSTLLEATGVAVEYHRRGASALRAVDGVDLSLGRGEILGLVGESGCGKSTLGRALVGLQPAAAGAVRFDGRDVTPLGRRRREPGLRGLQMVFQDPYASLNPRRRIGDQVGDGYVLGGTGRAEAARRAGELLERVGLPADAARRYPHEFSGGQRQRVAIARTLATDPRCIVADEPISALDASAQASVANLLVALVRELDMGMVFISHDLSVVRQIADRTAVMYLGRVVEVGPTREIWSSPAHPYTRALISAVPRADGAGVLPVELPGDVPDPARPPGGCRFHPRCPLALPECSRQDPPLAVLRDGRSAACVLQSPGEPPRPLPEPREAAPAAD